MTLQLNARLQPTDRGNLFEDNINFLLKKVKMGFVDGGGTLFKCEGGEFIYSDVEIVLYDKSEETIDKFISTISLLGIPKGSKLYGEGYKKEIGDLEGLAIYLNGTELPAEVYKKSNTDYVILELNKLLKTDGAYYSFWKGNTGTALYFYGKSFDTMKERIEPFLNEYPCVLVVG